jgi:hypothetical protein
MRTANGCGRPKNAKISIKALDAAFGVDSSPNLFIKQRNAREIESSHTYSYNSTVRLPNPEILISGGNLKLTGL